MTVQELIATLMEVEDLERKVYLFNDGAVLAENRGHVEVDAVVEVDGKLVIE